LWCAVWLDMCVSIELRDKQRLEYDKYLCAAMAWVYVEKE